MKGLSFIVKDKIDDILDLFFDRMTTSLLGRLPKFKGSKNIVFTTDQNDTLAHLFVQALGNRKPLPKEEDVLKGLVHTAATYVDALKAKTKNDLLTSIDSFAADSRAVGVEPSMKDISEIITQKMGKAQSHFKLISQAEATKFRNTGRYLNIKQANPTLDDPYVYFQPVKDDLTCLACKTTFLMEDGVSPKIFKMSEISSEYFNRKSPRPCIGGCHPHCFTKDQRIQTDMGNLKIKTLFEIGSSPKVSVDLRVERGDSIQIFRKENTGSSSYAATKIYDTGTRPCIRFTFANGAQLSVSEDHEMWISTGDSYRKVRAKEVAVGNKTPTISGEGLFGEDSFMEYAYQQGDVMNRIGMSDNIPELMWSANRETMKVFLQSFFDRNFQVVNGIGLVFFNHKLELLRDLNIALSMFGIPSGVNLKENETNLCIHGKKAVEIYCQKIGFSNPMKAKQVFSALPNFPDFALTFETGVISTEHLGNVQTYSLTVPVVNTVTANGIVTGNCRCSLLPLPLGWSVKNGKMSYVGKGYNEYNEQRGIK